MKWNRADRIGAITLTVAILALIAGWLVVPEFRNWTGLDSPRADSHIHSIQIAGTVVDGDTNRGVGQAAISIVGRAETYVTEDDGNFRISLQAPLPNDSTVRLHIAKSGYVPYDGTTTAPTESLVIQLRRM
jgi:hypothetical protein